MVLSVVLDLCVNVQSAASGATSSGSLVVLFSEFRLCGLLIECSLCVNTQSAARDAILSASITRGVFWGEFNLCGFVH